MPEPTRLALPRFEEPERPAGIPVVASLVPLAVALGAWALTRSPYALLFAIASPLAAAGSLLDRRIRGRRERREMLERTRARLTRLRTDIDAAHRAEREAIDRSAVDPARAPAGALPASAHGVRWGAGVVPSMLSLDQPDVDPPPELAEEVAELIAHAATLLAPVVTPVAEVISIEGPATLARAAARFVAVQWCLQDAEVRLRVAPEESWADPARDATPGARGTVGAHRSGARQPFARITWTGQEPGMADAVLRLGGAGPATLELHGREVVVRDLAVGMLGATTARTALERRRSGQLDVPGSLPTRVALEELAALDGPARPGLAAAVGRDASGVVWVDLVRDGPHAVVGGTTGSGKSELLISWVLAIAQHHPPDRVAFLLIDFKGASAFAPLCGLPHVVGIVSDLDTSVSRRATQSLRSELRRRERLLADAGARDIDEVPGIGRLVVVVDEYAALVAEHPELHELVGDLAARGRSLGIHLILCSQRPGGVMRDAVLANAVLRISLRVNNRADSLALIGTDDAASLPAAPAGRGYLAVGGAEPIAVQFAQSAESDLRRAELRHPAAAAPVRPWAEPLPDRVDLDRVPAAEEGVVFGIADLPDEQRIGAAVYRPDREGTLLVIGGRGAGTTTALAAIAAGLGERAVIIPPEPPDAWASLRAVLDAERPEDSVVIVDDVDVLVDGADEEIRPGLVRLLAALARELGARRGALVLGASRVPSSASALTSRIDSRLILALPDREQHVLAGGVAADWSARRPPGRGWWQGREVQIAVGARMPPPRRIPMPTIEVAPGRPLAIASGTADRLGARFRATGTAVLPIGAGAEELERVADVPAVVLGDPDEWTAAWSALETARRALPFLVHGASAAELRALGRVRGDPPPLDPRGGEAWLLIGRRVERVRMPDAVR